MADQIKTKKKCPARKVHYDMIRNNQGSIISKLDRELGFYRIYFEKKIKGLEIIYDTPNNLLSSAGIVLSKQYESGKFFFKVKKLSYLPTEFRKPSEKFYLLECQPNESPKDYPLQISTAINNAFANVFTIDLVDVVKNTIPKYEIKIKGDLYILTSGLGMKGQIVFEKASYKDLLTNKKVKRLGATVTLPGDPAFKKETSEVLDAIERKCKELLIYQETRFEIAQRLLSPKHQTEKLDKNKIKKSKNNKNNEEKDEN